MFLYPDGARVRTFASAAGIGALLENEEPMVNE